MKRKFRDLLITYDLLITWQPVDDSDTKPCNTKVILLSLSWRMSNERAWMEFKTNINSKDYLSIQFETVVHLRAWGLEGAIVSRTGGISNHVLEISWEIQFKNVPAPFWSAGPPPPPFGQMFSRVIGETQPRFRCGDIWQEHRAVNSVFFNTTEQLDK